MIKIIKDLEINYTQYGKGDDIVLLHGWGQNIEMMEPLGKNLCEKNRITILDFPGFGGSQIPNFAYTIYDYTELLKEFLDELKIENPILIGHSFGGRIAICYAARYKVSKLVLLASPFRSLEKKGLKVKILKTLGSIKILKGVREFAKNHMGSRDYREASGVMRDVLVNTVNANLENEVKSIKCETLIIWGEDDDVVPASEARELESRIEGSASIILPGTHYCYLENLGQVINILKHFI